MRPTVSRSEFEQLVRQFLVSALLLAGIGTAISLGAPALELIAMR
jgi:hypothetical protein